MVDDNLDYRDDFSKDFDESNLNLQSNNTGSKIKSNTKDGSATSVERQVLSRICDNIIQNKNSLNGCIRRTFSLQDVLMCPENPNEFLDKP